MRRAVPVSAAIEDILLLVVVGEDDRVVADGDTSVILNDSALMEAHGLEVYYSLR